MSVTILTTKLHMPPTRPGRVARHHLIERLNEGLNRKLTLVSAPAGFGKTTLVSEWVTASERPVVWLSLDERDNDTTRFLTYMIAALQTITPEVGNGVMAALQSAQPPRIDALLTTLLNDIASTPQKCILVLDDYHLLDSAQVDDAIAFLLEHLPPQMHLVIATRTDPHLPLARLRARGQLTELRAADLRFTGDEAAEFLNQVTGLALSAEHITTLEARTEGWIAGLQLAALSMEGRSDVSQFINSFSGSHRYVLDYLVAEVLQQQPDSIQTFLLQTAILDRLTGPLCDALTGQENGQATLEYLEQTNLFIVPLDETRQWYRYHHLFADLLRQRLQQTHPQQMPTLHSRASEWFEQNDLPHAAIQHALAAGDVERAADLIELAGPLVEQSFYVAMWLGWAGALPDVLIRTRPVLSVCYAYALLGRGEMAAAEARLTDAERSLESADNTMVVVDEAQFQVLPATIAVARAYIAQARGDVPGTVKQAQRVLDLLPEGDHHRREQATGLLGITCWASGDLEAANRVFADYTMKLWTAGNIADAISTACVLAEIRTTLGRLHEAASTLEQLLQFVIDQETPVPPDVADLYRGLGELYLESGEWDAAEQHLLKSRELGEQAELSAVSRYRWCVAQARFAQTQGKLDAALDWLREAERQFIKSPLPEVRPIPAMKARIWAAQGRLAEALAWADERNLSVDDDLSYLHEFEHITLTWILIAQYQDEMADTSLQNAIELLDRLQQAAQAGKRIGSQIEILVLRALAHEAQNNTASALTSLERALALAEPEGCVRPFVENGPRVMRLLYAALSQGMAPAYVQRLLAAVPAAESTQAEHASTSESGWIEPLTDRELEILRLIAAGCSNHDICERLVLALSTVKGHNRNIYHKLQVQRRTEAVARARALGLLDE